MLRITRKGKANKIANMTHCCINPSFTHLEYSVQFCPLKKDREELEKVHSRLTGQAKLRPNFCTRNSAWQWVVSSWKRDEVGKTVHRNL